MLSAMASRLPSGGIRARYQKILQELPQDEDPEELLCNYPLPERIQKFFDEFVGKYGHSSIQEQTGDPAIYVEEVSWFTNWLLFDSPLVSGQEFSTRAVQKKDWPTSKEGFHYKETHYEGCTIEYKSSLHEEFVEVTNVVFCNNANPTLPFDVLMRTRSYHPKLLELHRGWLEVFEAEVEWWNEHLSHKDNREALGIADKEPFRPALDRARWALPGTISLGACFTSNVRERARALRDGALIGGGEEQEVWADIVGGYLEALPGISKHAFREAPPDYQLPGHLKSILCPVEGVGGGMTEVTLHNNMIPGAVTPFTRKRVKTYADPWLNHETRVSLRIECSLGVARDWHRHRTLYPWHLGVVRESLGGAISIDRHYSPKSPKGKEALPELLARSQSVHDDFLGRGDIQRAALALPMGTKVVVSGSGGLRDALYMLELRAMAHGKNFEYEDQALEALAKLGAS